MKTRTLTLLALLVLASVSSFADDPIAGGLYRLSSGRGSNRIMTVGDDGKLTTRARSDGNLGQVWILTKTGQGSNGTMYTLRSALTGQYVQEQKSLNTNFYTADGAKNFYVREHPGIKGYFNFSNEDSFTGLSCIHEDAQFKVVPWSASSSATLSASEWKLEAVTDITVEQVSENIISKSPYSELEEGGVYRIISAPYGRAVCEMSSSATVTTEASSDDASQYWKFVKTGSGYSLQNMYTHRNIQRQGGTVSTQYKTSASSSAFTVRRNTAFPYDIMYDIVDNGSIVLHCAASQGNNVVGWYASDGESNQASVWRLQKVEVSDEELQKAYEGFVEQQSTLKSLTAIRLRLNKFFTDNSCTELKDDFNGLDDGQLRDTLDGLPSVLVDMAVKVKNDSWQKWEREFRVARYGAYSDAAYWANRLSLSAYGRQNNPTGILADKNEMLYVFVGSRIPSGSTLTIETCSTTGVQAAYSQKLSRGLNLVVVPENNSQVYVNYLSANGREIADFDSIGIHIEGGRVNGYFSTARHSDADWEEMWSDGLFSGPVIDVKGSYVMMHMNSTLFRQNVGSRVHRIMDIWDGIVRDELDLMGLLRNDSHPEAYEDLYPRRFNNLMECVSIDYSYMFSTWYYTAYNEGTLSTILNYSKMAEGDGSLWGPAHEIGHSNQGAIKIVGSTEISNNLFSNAIVYLAGNYVSRGFNMQNVQPWLARKLSWPEMYNQGDVMTMTRLFYSLYLYYHVLGNDSTFYQRLFHELRNDPLVHPANPSVMSGKDDYLKFARLASKVAGEDLTDFFDYWGFFRPISNVAVGDYANYTVTTTQADIDEAMQYIKSCGKPNRQIIFIEDRVRQVRKADGTYKKALGESPYSECKSKMGQYEDYPLNLEPSGYIYSVTASGRVTVPSAARNAVGMIVYDKGGRLAYAADTYTFTLPEYLVDEGGYTIYSVRSNGKLTKMYNRNADEYYTVDVYRKASRPFVYYTDGDVSGGTVPELGANDIAVVRSADAPASLASMTNVVGPDSVAANVELADTVGYYAPFEFTAAKFSFTSSLPAAVSNKAYPFAVDASAFSSVGKVMTYKGTEFGGGQAYVVAGDTTGTLEPSCPLLVVRKGGNAPAEWRFSGENVRLAGSGRQSTIGEANFVANFLDTEHSGTSYQGSADGSAFSKRTGRYALKPFAVWLSPANDDYDAYLLKDWDTVGIDNAKALRPANAGGRIYTIDGVRVTAPQKGAIYIIDGRKVVY